MTELVPASEIEAKVGVPRHPFIHHARAVSAEDTVYILHSQECLNTGTDLRGCRYSIALDHGIVDDHWAGYEDKPVALGILIHSTLTPVRTCSACGCTDNYACDGGCWWPDPYVDVCSRCWKGTAATDQALEESTPPDCANHLERQHRDGKGPWCAACGWTHGRPAVPARKIAEPKERV